MNFVILHLKHYIFTFFYIVVILMLTYYGIINLYLLKIKLFLKKYSNIIIYIIFSIAECLLMFYVLTIRQKKNYSNVSTIITCKILMKDLLRKPDFFFQNVSDIINT